MPASSTTSTQPREAGRPAARLVEQPVERRRRGCRSRPGASRRRRPTARRRARGRPRARRPARRRAWRSSCRRPARPTTQTTRSGSWRRSRTIASCSSESADPVGTLDLVEPLLADRWRVGVAAALDERERRPLDREQLARSSSAPAGPARRLADALDARPVCDEPRREPADPLGAAPWRVRLAPRPSRARDRRTPSASRSARAARAAARAISSSSLARARCVADARRAARCSSRAAEAVLGGARAPVLAQPRQVDVLLALARLERRDLGGVEAARCRARPCCSTTCARRVENSRITSRGTPASSAIPLYGVSHSTPERAGQLGAQLGLVEVAGGEPVGLQDRLAVERAPLAVAGASAPCWRRSRACAGAGPARGWCGAGRRRRRSPRRARGCTPLRAAAGDAGLVLEVGERRLPGGEVRLVDRPAGLLVAERVQEADALRRARRQGRSRRPGASFFVSTPRSPRQRVDPLDRDRSRPRVACRSCSPVSGWWPRISRAELAVLRRRPSSSSSAAPRPAQTPGDSPRPA